MSKETQNIFKSPENSYPALVDKKVIRAAIKHLPDFDSLEHSAESTDIDTIQVEAIDPHSPWMRRLQSQLDYLGIELGFNPQLFIFSYRNSQTNPSGALCLLHSNRPNRIDRVFQLDPQVSLELGYPSIASHHLPNTNSSLGHKQGQFDALTSY